MRLVLCSYNGSKSFLLFLLNLVHDIQNEDLQTALMFLNPELYMINEGRGVRTVLYCSTSEIFSAPLSLPLNLLLI